jgi:hypothetical protein
VLRVNGLVWHRAALQGAGSLLRLFSGYRLDQHSAGCSVTDQIKHPAGTALQNAEGLTSAYERFLKLAGRTIMVSWTLTIWFWNKLDLFSIGFAVAMQLVVL